MIGTVRTNKHGRSAEVIEYKNKKDFTLKFDNGIIEKRTNFNGFLDGKFQAPAMKDSLIELIINVDDNMEVVGLTAIDIMTLEKINDFNDFDAFFSCFQNSNTVAFVYNLSLFGEYIVNYLQGKGCVASEKLVKGKTYKMTESEDTIYKMIYQEKAETITFKNITTIYPGKREDHNDIFNHQYGSAAAIKHMKETGNLDLTIGAAALADWKQKCKYDIDELFTNKINDDEDYFLRKSFHGGLVIENEAYKNIEDILVGLELDCNSEHPAQMYYKPLPCGRPIHFKGEYVENADFPLWIAKVKLTDLMIKDKKFPCIKPEWTEDSTLIAEEFVEYYDSTLTITITSVDWEMIQDTYYIYEYEFIEGYMFRQAPRDLHHNFIDSWMDVKMNKEGAERQLAKLFLNNIFGKFASKRFRNTTVRNADGLKEPGLKGSYRGFGHIAHAAFITSYSRTEHLTLCNEYYDYCAYGDTDSAKLVGITEEQLRADGKINIHRSNLGAWKIEGTFEDAIFLGAKKYAILDSKKNEWNFTIAGLADDTKDLKKQLANPRVSFQKGKSIKTHRYNKTNNGLEVKNFEFKL